MGTADLRDDSGVSDRAAFTRGIDELQAAMLVVPSEVLYGRASPISGRSASAGFPTR